MEEIKKFVTELFDTNQISIQFLENSGYRDNDLICTFFSYLISKCFLRLATGYMTTDVYVLTKPAKSILKNEISRDVFINEFLKFMSN